MAYPSSGFGNVRARVKPEIPLCDKDVTASIEVES
jgi:hypothetical protein